MKYAYMNHRFFQNFQKLSCIKFLDFMPTTGCYINQLPPLLLVDDSTMTELFIERDNHHDNWLVGNLFSCLIALVAASPIPMFAPVSVALAAVIGFTKTFNLISLYL
jgi:hypothetical protein